MLCTYKISVLFDVSTFLKKYFSNTSLNQEQTASRKGCAKVGNRGSFLFSFFEGFGFSKKKCTLVCLVHLCSVLQSLMYRRLMISVELIPSFIVTHLQTSKKKGHSFCTYKHNFQSWRRVIFTCKFKRRVCIICLKEQCHVSYTSQKRDKAGSKDNSFFKKKKKTEAFAKGEDASLWFSLLVCSGLCP